MAYDANLGDRIRRLFEQRNDVVEKSMFGGIAFMLRGNMCVGVTKNDLMVRVGPDVDAMAMTDPHTKPFDMTGRPMKGWVLVEPAGVATPESLGKWVQQGVAYAESLPPK